jgi:hypothetical protein
MKNSLVLPLVLLAALATWPPVPACAESFPIVEVREGDTLYKMCSKQYGKCSENLVRSIRKLNPWLRKADLIKVGDRIKFPLPKSKIGTAVTAEKVTAGPASVHGGSAGPSIASPATGASLGTATAGNVAPATAAPATAGPPQSTGPAYEQYPGVMVGRISQLKWLSDNTAMITGTISRQPDGENVFSFIVSVDGDLDYPQQLQIAADGKFIAFASIGRPFEDYGRKFTLKLVHGQRGKQVSQISETVIKEQNRAGTINFNSPQGGADRINGTAGIESWIKAQSVNSKELDNSRFKTKDGLVIRNYRFVNYNPDEKYLGRYGRVTLYGSSTIAKYLVIKGDLPTAKKILDVWCDLLDDKGGVPRSANVVGDTYVSPDVRTGDMAYFLGALALYKASSASEEYDGVIKKLLYTYFKPLQDPLTGLVRGGYSSSSNGYSGGGQVEYVSWASAEHNFDLFQALVLLSRLFSGPEKEAIVGFYQTIGKGLDTYMWDKENNTFNRGYRFETGFDKAKALDCSSWGALYLLKQAALAAEAKIYAREDFYMRRASTALDFIDRNFKATWCYTTAAGKKGCISGYKPYAGTIDDVRDDATQVPIDWDRISDLVWSEGTLGVAIAQYQMWCKKSSGMDVKNCARFYDLVDQMLELQSLGQTGGLLYTSKRIEGHFTQGEELASLAWLGYALIIKGNEYSPGIEKYKKVIPW